MDYEKIDELLLNGSLEVSGITEDGSFTFVFTNKLKENDPETYAAVTRHFYSLIAKFWEMGFLEFDISESNPLVRLTDKAFDREAISQLSEMERINLNLVIQGLSQQ